MGCEVDCNLDKLVWRIASPLLAEQAGLLRAHSLSMAPYWHSPHRQSHLECSCCLLSKVRLMSGGGVGRMVETNTLVLLHRTSSFASCRCHSLFWCDWQIATDGQSAGA